MQHPYSQRLSHQHRRIAVLAAAALLSCSGWAQTNRGPNPNSPPPTPTAGANTSSPSGTSPGGLGPSGMPDLFISTAACQMNPAGGPPTHVSLTLGNKGPVQAGGHTTTVIFPNAQPDAREVTYIRLNGPAGSKVSVAIPIPASAWVGNELKFAATIDSTGAVAESDEGNNMYSGRCQRPGL